MDVRACYTALSVAHILGLDKEDICRRSGLVDFVRRCQVASVLRVVVACCTLLTVSEGILSSEESAKADMYYLPTRERH